MNWQTVKDLNNIQITDNLIVVYGKCHPENADMIANNLNENEKFKYKKYRNKTPLECRAVLRILLSKYLNTPPEKIAILETKSGKPYIEHNALFFNVSHTDSAFLIAISKMGRIGVDIELLSGNEDLNSLTDYVFSDDEKLMHFDPGDENRYFLKIWTLKEAFLKATGIGLVNDLKRVNTYTILQKYKLNFSSFVCPDNETASIVYRGTHYQAVKPGYFHIELVI